MLIARHTLPTGDSSTIAYGRMSPAPDYLFSMIWREGLEKYEDLYGIGHSSRRAHDRRLQFWADGGR